MRAWLAALTIAFCAAAPSLASAQEADPWEGFNRDMFAAHESIDRAVIQPVARGYRAVTSAPVRASVRNFLANLSSPVTFTNDLLQGEANRAAVTAARLGVNTTVGVLGLFDPATHMGLERHEEDFGQTLAVWGVGAGPYIFVPVLGPTTLRDGAGRLIDIALDPISWVEFENAGAARATRTVAGGVSAREGLLEIVDDMRRTSLDPYVTIRTSYGLLRESAVRNGRREVEDLPEFDDILEMEGEAPADPAEPGVEAPAPSVDGQAPSAHGSKPGASS